MLQVPRPWGQGNLTPGHMYTNAAAAVAPPGTAGSGPLDLWLQQGAKDGPFHAIGAVPAYSPVVLGTHGKSKSLGSDRGADVSEAAATHGTDVGTGNREGRAPAPKL
jgi:hypothetical protein